MPNCYKCKCTENLSIKRSSPKTGYVLHICRPCRREVAKLYTQTKQPVIKFKDQDQWEQLAWETNTRIMQKYAKA